MMSNIKLTVEERISKAIIALQGSVGGKGGGEQPFFAHLLMGMEFREMPKWAPMQTMGVDALGRCYYCKEFVDTLSDEELRGVLSHECLHSALLHLLRVGGRNKIVANVAQDIVVNMIVTQSGLKLPKGGIDVNVSGDYSDFSLGKGVRIRVNSVSEKLWEKVYDEITSQLKKQGIDVGDGEGPGFDLHIRGDGTQQDSEGSKEGRMLSDKEVERAEQEWSKRLVEAAAYAKQRGCLPGGVDKMIGHLLEPTVDWRSLLRNHMSPFLSPVDWTYQRLSKKSQILEIALPNVLKEHVSIGVVCDTSGSIDGEAMTEFLSEMVGMAQSLRHIDMRVVFVDTEVKAEYEVGNGDIDTIMSMKPQGGGGTGMEVGIDHFKDKYPDLSVVVVLTDGYDSYNRGEGDYPFEVIWCIQKNGNDQMPYGVKVRMG
jgi:predicted metal-dependent peptidase